MLLKRVFSTLKGALWLALTGSAFATPALPASALVEQAVKEALSEPDVTVTKAQPSAVPQQVVAKTAAPKPAAAKADATRLREQGVAKAQTSAAKRTPRVAVVRATAYNSEVGQTDSTPFITATGTRTRFGVIALSRDLLAKFPYGTRVRLEDMSGRYNSLLAGRVFIVEDTMAARKRNSLDIWMSSRSQALQWGARNIRITAIQ
ncbi:3D domain-containing protein [Deinococcus peraridilitoris]|uniref:3D domain-containing protein n=1 Tax=Deinococcus peraridilitoris (strain DSM 19664 / LMG 22246 / CIP 109416 / KR-200) TaxID=937777 RepID=L0A4E4_DEIPD|nr:3D domain-containing protein [Deinococcus peraridilitoris]AFZ68758.1 hypothetical protein Deipe_3318 [Deinococcus peraridilitoris DSM 19664]